MLEKSNFKHCAKILTIFSLALRAEPALSASDTEYLIFKGGSLFPISHVYEINDNLSREALAGSLLSVPTSLAVLSIDRFCGKLSKPAKVLAIDIHTTINKRVAAQMLKQRTVKEIEGLLRWNNSFGGGVPAYPLRIKGPDGKIQHSISIIPNRQFAKFFDESRMFNSENKMPIPYIYGYCFDYVNDKDRKNQEAYPLRPYLKGHDKAKWNLIRKDIVTVADVASQIWFKGNKQLKPSGIFLRIHAKKMNIPNHPEIAYRVRAVMTRGIPIKNIVTAYQKDPEKTKRQVIAYAADVLKDGSRVLCPMNNPRDFVFAEFFNENGPTCADKQKASKEKQDAKRENKN